MISYETYKILHLCLILTFFSSLGFIASNHPIIEKKRFKVVLGLVSFFLLVAGMGLIARLGFKHGQMFPLWINLKFVLWLLANILIVTLFKIQKAFAKKAITLLILSIGILAIGIVILKPI